MRDFIHKLQAKAMKAAYSVLRTLPISYASCLAKGVGLLFSVLPVKNRVLNNLRLTGFKPNMSVQEFVQQVGTHCAHLFFDYAYIKKYAQESYRWPMDSNSHRILADLQQTGKGAVFVTAHFANWEMIRFAARAQGHEIGMIYRPFNNPYVDAHALELAREAGSSVFRKGSQGLREMVKHIRSGKSVLILVDQRAGGAPVLDFMEQPAETSLAAAELAIKFKVPLIPCYAQRQENDMACFTVTIEEPVIQDTPENMMQSVNNRISHWITKKPVQWFWVHNRWKKR